VANTHLAEVPGLYPPRWRTSPLDDATLAKLRERAIDESKMLEALHDRPIDDSTTSPVDDAIRTRRRDLPSSARSPQRGRVRPPSRGGSYDPPAPRPSFRRPPLGLFVAIAIAVALVIFAFTR
ncbi:MAG: hypothetical protein KF819_38595, partial [Labilithrix sp.]|nr:hypothetical protein [Labilithrix sp.]